MSVVRQRAGMALAVAATHRERILAALAHLHGQVPANGSELAHADYAVVASAELLTSRFGKLLDHLGGQLVPLALEVAAEPLPATATFLDRLLRLEKLRAVPSMVEFRRLRELRNGLARLPR